MIGRKRGGGGKGGSGAPRLGGAENVFDLPGALIERRQREFCDAITRLKTALVREKSVPVATRQALVAELGAFDCWTEPGAKLLPAPLGTAEIARRILLLDYRLNALRPMGAELDNSLRHAVRQYAEASHLLLDACARRDPSGEWLDRPRRTEIESLVRVLIPDTPAPGGDDGQEP